MLLDSFFLNRKNIEELAQLAAENQKAFEVLYKKMVNKAYNYFAVRTSSKTVAEELTQELFLKLITALKNYQKTKAPFEAWFFKVANNLLIDYYRKDESRKNKLNSIKTQFKITGSGSSKSKDINIAVHEAIKQLPDNYKNVIVLSFFEGLKGKEIAYILDTSEENVRVMKYRALRKLKEFLGY